MKALFKKLAFTFFLAFIFTSCSEKEVLITDETKPSISIISPELNQTYISEWGGAWPKGDIITLEAFATDNVKINTISVQVLLENGDVVFEKIEENLSEKESEFVFSTTFVAKLVANYVVIFTATDSNGNSASSSPRTFKTS